MTVLAGFYIKVKIQVLYRLSRWSFSAKKQVFIVSVRRPYRLLYFIKSFLNEAPMGTIRPPYQPKYFFGPRRVFCAQTQSGQNLFLRAGALPLKLLRLETHVTCMYVYNLRVGSSLRVIYLYEYSRYRMLSIFRISILRHSIQNLPYLIYFLDLES